MLFRSGAPLVPFLPVGAQARPNEVTFSEDWMRPDFVPPAVTPPGQPGDAPIPQAPLPAESPVVPVDPAAGLPGMMVPSEAGS